MQGTSERYLHEFFCEKWHSLSVRGTNLRKDANSGRSARLHTAGLMNNFAKSLKKWREKYSCSTKKDEEFWLCISGRGVAEIIIVFTEDHNNDETHPTCQIFLQQYCAMPNVETITRRSKICHGDSLQRRENAPKFDDRSQEETEWQEHWARQVPWRLAKKILKETHKAAFFSPTEKWCLPSPSKIKPEEREFVVDF